MGQSSEMDSYFSELGGMVYDRWKKVDFSPRAFAEIATAALVERPPADNINLPELVREFLLDDAQPVQAAELAGAHARGVLGVVLVHERQVGRLGQPRQRLGGPVLRRAFEPLRQPDPTQRYRRTA